MTAIYNRWSPGKPSRPRAEDPRFEEASLDASWQREHA
jgi:hypothetical protein